MSLATQFGFPKQRNTIAVTLFLDEIRQNIEPGKKSSFGIRGKEKELFANYLYNRKQAVRFRSDLSDL